MIQAQEWKMSPWQLIGNEHPTYWHRLVWRRRWVLWASERNAREQRQVEEMELRRMQNG